MRRYGEPRGPPASVVDDDVPRARRRACSARSINTTCRIHYTFCVLGGILACVVAVVVVGLVEEARRQAESRALHIAFSICGENWDGYIGLTSAVSLLYSRATLGTTETRARRLHLHFAIDTDASRSLPRTLQYQRLLRYASRTPEVVLHWHLLDEVAASSADVFTHLFRKCSGARLRLMRELQGTSRVLYLDWDTVVHCDVAAAWDALFGAMESADAGLAMAPEGLYSGPSASAPGWYPRWGLPTAIPGGFNAGALAIRAAYFRNASHVNVTALLDGFVEAVRAGGYKGYAPVRTLYRGDYSLALGDQDLLNVAALLHPGLVSVLPLAFNWRHDTPFDVADVGAGGIVLVVNRSLSLTERANNSIVAVPPFVDGETCVVHYNDFKAFRSEAFRFFRALDISADPATWGKPPPGGAPLANAEFGPLEEDPPRPAPSPGPAILDVQSLIARAAAAAALRAGGSLQPFPLVWRGPEVRYPPRRSRNGNETLPPWIGLDPLDADGALRSPVLTYEQLADQYEHLTSPQHGSFATIVAAAAVHVPHAGASPGSALTRVERQKEVEKMGAALSHLSPQLRGRRGLGVDSDRGAPFAEDASGRLGGTLSSTGSASGTGSGANAPGRLRAQALRPGGDPRHRRRPLAAYV